MAIHSYKVLGLMSGSSLDGLDIAYVHFDIDPDSETNNQVRSWSLEHAATLPFSEKWQTRLHHLPRQDALSFCKTHTYFGHYMGELVESFLEKFQLQPDFIASHGHTIFHFPDKRVTVQIGDGAALAATSGYPVVCDFRTHDIAINGEGAPLAPLADKLIFKGYDFYLNLGGIANISANVKEKFVAFDIGAANQVLNALANQLELEYDDRGEIASSGQILEDLLARLNQIEFFSQAYPKSLDNGWIQQNITPLYFSNPGAWADKLRTACEQLAIQTAKSIQTIITREGLKQERYSLLVTGGGAFNSFLLKCISNKCPMVDLQLPSVEIIQFKEAILMALMGVLRLENIPNCLATATGAKFDTIGGAFYQGSKYTI